MKNYIKLKLYGLHQSPNIYCVSSVSDFLTFNSNIYLNLNVHNMF